MQEMKPGPVSPAKPAPSVPQETPGFELLNKLHSLFLRKADTKFDEAQQLLNPQTPAPTNIADSLDTGKLSKLINYIKNGTPSLILMYSTCGLLF
ncbi:hypothetical protein [Sporomusa sp.]|uniref:hypothetical protein n=1 Tax=Sporomusa sp. TaxID=2078658 RepID=UPI002C6FF930|nr:hypothetical protein [Sporomusa sp.]HWR44927.1 hypothetical protein [Sporomusa sp.]